MKVSTDQETIQWFLKHHGVAVLSTVNEDGSPHGTCIYFIVHDDRVYFVTRSGTQKFRNVLRDPRVAFTIFDQGAQQTLQAHGVAKVLPYEEKADRKELYTKLVDQAEASAGEGVQPPIMHLKRGGLVVFTLDISEAALLTYAGIEDLNQAVAGKSTAAGRPIRKF